MRGSTEKMVPMFTLALMFEEPSSGSKLMTYLPTGWPSGTGTMSSSSSEASTASWPVEPSTRWSVSCAN